jgi:hypothetical protein
LIAARSKNAENAGAILVSNIRPDVEDEGILRVERRNLGQTFPRFGSRQFVKRIAQPERNFFHFRTTLFLADNPPCVLQSRQ